MFKNLGIALEARAAELGVRVDGGDAETGVGTELGARVGYAHPAGLNVVARGRFVLGNGENEFDQWGASVEVTLDPGAGGWGARPWPWSSMASGTRRAATARRTAVSC